MQCENVRRITPFNYQRCQGRARHHVTKRLPYQRKDVQIHVCAFCFVEIKKGSK